MYQRLRFLLVIFLLFASPVWAEDKVQTIVAADQATVRVAIIGGMSITTELWRNIAEMFEADTGYHVMVIAAGPRPGLAKAMREGKVDLLTMHSGDITTDLVADGFAVHMRPWTKNDLIIVGPASDPARIAGFKSGAAALKKIAETKSNFIDVKGIGPRELGNTLWKRAGIVPSGKWFLQDESKHADILSFAEKKNAYMIIGRIPVVTGKLGSHNLKIMVDKDPTMRRPYIVMEANPEKFPQANIKGAKAFSDYLLSDKIQSYLAKFGKEKNNGIPMFYPVKEKYLIENGLGSK
jgi:tungstate transport system substrate-binding protein